MTGNASLPVWGRTSSVTDWPVSTAPAAELLSTLLRPDSPDRTSRFLGLLARPVAPSDTFEFLNERKETHPCPSSESLASFH